ncbi:MAG: hypothetical protein H6510_00745 [Acidobacteria bacterium]|nr:hypothetical protein [Acidobacteriota bacterium]MCB9396315.1 hypothetical protein [Acidobacteriota bacterium]
MLRNYCLCVFAVSLFAQNWRWDNPKPQGNSLNSIFVTPGMVFAAGVQSTLISQPQVGLWRTFQNNFDVDFRGIYAAHDQAVFAVAGDFSHGGTIYFYDGVDWSQMPENESRYFAGVWGTSETNVYAVGYSPSIGSYALRRFDGSLWNPLNSPIPLNGLFAIHGWGPQDVLAVGGNGIIRYDGDGDNNNIPDDIWEDDSPTGLAPGYFLYGVTTFSGNNAIAVGRDQSGQGLALLRESNIWLQMDLPTTFQLNAVWSAAPNLAWAVGTNGTILKYDGAWQAFDSGTKKDLICVWGRTASEVYAGGEDGTLLRFDGQHWQPIYPQPGARQDFRRVWSDGSEVFVTGYGPGASLNHYANGVWYNNQTFGDTRGDIWAQSGSAVYVVGGAGAAQRWNGQAWQKMTSNTTVFLYDVYGLNPDSVFAVGNFGGNSGTLLFFDGNSNLDWTVLTDTFTYSIDRVWGKSTSNMILGASGTNRLFQWNGMMVNEITPAGMPYNAQIWGPSEGHYFVAGSGGTILRYLGGWSTMVTGSSASFLDLWGTSGSDVYALGNDGLIYHYDGNVGLNWVSASLPLDAGLNAGCLVGGSVLLVGDAATLFRSQGNVFKAGTAWTAETVPAISTPFLMSAYGRTWTDIDVVGVQATLLHSSGLNWQTELVTTDTDITFRHVQAFDDGKKVVVGGKGSEGSSITGRAYLFDGSWQQMNLSSTMMLDAYGSSSSNIYAVGWLGNIRHYDGNISLDWTTVTTDTTKKLYGVWADGLGGLAVGENGTVVSFNPTSGTSSSITGADLLLCVLGGVGDYFVGGRTSGDLDGIIYRGGPGSWTAMTFDINRANILAVRAIWGTSSNLWAVAGQVSDGNGGGKIFHYDGNPGNLWVEQPSLTTKSMRDIQFIGQDPDNMIIVGEDGFILKNDSVLAYFESLIDWPTTTILDLILNLP